MSSPYNLDSLLNYDPRMQSFLGKFERPFDRRQRARVAVHWTVYLLRKFAPHPIESFTRDLSSSGFYCVVAEPFVAGEPLQCRLLIPTHGGSSSALCLHGQVRILRVENLGPEGYGIACAIESYKIAALDTTEISPPHPVLAEQMQH
jgi:hypothetical protein